MFTWINNKVIASGIIGASAIVLSASVAKAATFDTMSGYTDNQFNSDKTNGLFEEDWVTEGRAARNNWDKGIWDWTTNNTQQLRTQVESPWPNGTYVPITITYNNGNLQFQWNGQSISYNNITEAARFPNGLNTLYLRTRSNNNGSTVLLDNITLTDDQGISTTSLDLLSNNSLNVDYLRISGIEGNFILTADATFTWTGPNSPNDSQLAFQVKGGYAVPEPFTILGATTAVLFGTTFKRKLSQKKDKQK